MRRPAAGFLAALVAVVLGVFTFAAAPAFADGWHLPWPAGQSVYVTQDCNDSCCGDHVGRNAYAWDFATNGAFDVVAPRAGTIVHVKMSSNHGGDAEQVDSANYVVIDHGDGTASIMLHLAQGSLDPNVHCGEFVRAGQHLARTGSTGWSSGNHLHFQVGRIPPGMGQTCECGGDGMACSAESPHWDLFWSFTEASATLPVRFEEWPDASLCADRHDSTILTSRNRDAGEAVAHVTPSEPGRFTPVSGRWAQNRGGVSGAFFAAGSSQAATGFLSFAGRVPHPGLYEVWAGLPVVGRNVGARDVAVEVVARGERVQSRQSQVLSGGGYHPLPGRFRLTGREGEGMFVSSAANAGESLAVDGVVLRYVGESGAGDLGMACTNASQCNGDLVCNGGQCASGCEVGGCGAGQTCDATGQCLTPNGSAANTMVAQLGTVPAPHAATTAATAPPPAVVHASMDPSGGGPMFAHMADTAASHVANAPAHDSHSSTSGHGKGVMELVLSCALGALSLAVRKH